MVSKAYELSKRFCLEVKSRQTPGDALIVQKEGFKLRIDGHFYAWHEGLLHTLREAGERHPWVRLSGLRPGHKVLDCTLGLGTDARFLSEMTGHEVIALEKVKALALLATLNLEAKGAMIRVINQDAKEFLVQCRDNQFDLIIADPMFPSHLKRKSSNLDLVRLRGDTTPLDHEWLSEALRVSRGSVIMKDHKDNSLLEDLGAEYIWAKGKRMTRYGVWRPPLPT